MKIPVRLYSITVKAGSGGEFVADINCQTEQGALVQVWSDYFFDPLTALQAVTAAYGELQA